MARLINAVFFVLLASLPAFARRARHLEEVILKTETLEEGKKDAIESAEKIKPNKDNPDLQADGLRDAGEEQRAAAKSLTQEVAAETISSSPGLAQGSDASFKWIQMLHQVDSSGFQKVDAHNTTQATGDAEEEFAAALKVASSAILATAKAAATAEFNKNIDPGSGNAQKSKKEADTAAAMLIDAETMLWEKTELLAGEAFGGEAIVKCLLDDYVTEYVSDNEKTVERLLGILHTHLDRLEHENAVFNRENPHYPPLEKLRSRLSAVESQVKAMQGQELDSDEIDLTSPSLSENNGMHLEIVKWMIKYIKVVQLDLMPNAVVQNVEGTKASGKNQSKVVLDDYLMAVGRVEQGAEMELVINKAIAVFGNAEVPTPAYYRLAKRKLEQAVKVTMAQLEAFDPKMVESQKAKIANALKEKRATLSF